MLREVEPAASLAGAATSATAVVLSIIGKGPLFLRVSGIVLGVCSVALWSMLVFFDLIVYGQFVR
jgi:hypothetical protein